jgi:hypothetical protein
MYTYHQPSMKGEDKEEGSEAKNSQSRARIDFGGEWNGKTRYDWDKAQTRTLKPQLIFVVVVDH